MSFEHVDIVLLAIFVLLNRFFTAESLYEFE